jgi:hypothetical protein
VPAATVSRLTLILIFPLLVPAQVPDRKPQALAHAADVFTNIQTLTDRNLATRAAATLAAEVCKYDKAAGSELFTRARLMRPPTYKVPVNIGDRGFVLSLAVACDPALREDFGEISPESQARADLTAAILAVREKEVPAAELAGFLERAAEGFPYQDRPGMLALMDVLQQVRMWSPEQANAAFLQAAASLTTAAPEGAIQGLFTLATYLFQAPGQDDPRSVIVRPLEGGGSAYYFSQARAGIAPELIAAFLRMASPQLAVMSGAGTVQTRRQALAHQLLPLAGRYHPASIADLQTAAGLKTSVAITPEVEALLRPVDLSKPDFEKDLAAKAEDELDVQSKDELHLALITFLLQSNRAREARAVLPKIASAKLRNAIAGLVAFKEAEEWIAAGRREGAMTAVAGAPEALYPAILSLALASSPDSEIASRMAVCLDLIGRAEVEHRSPLLTGAAALLARRNREFAQELLRQAVLEANQALVPKRRADESEPLLAFAFDVRGFLATLRFGRATHQFRLQPKGLPLLSFSDAIRSLREADAVVLSEIAGKLHDEAARARAMVAVIAVELEQAFRPAPSRKPEPR